LNSDIINFTPLPMGLMRDNNKKDYRSKPKL